VAKSILRVLAVRGIEPTSEQADQILECTDVDQLNEWLDRAVTAEKADDIFHA